MRRPSSREPAGEWLNPHLRGRVSIHQGIVAWVPEAQAPLELVKEG